MLTSHSRIRKKRRRSLSQKLLDRSTRRRQAVANAVDLLLMVEQEMQAYYDDRLETWKEGDKGETFQERLEAIYQAREGVEEIDIG